MSNRRRASSTSTACVRVSIGLAVGVLVVVGPLATTAGAAGRGHAAVPRSAVARSARTSRSHGRQPTEVVPSTTAPPGGTVFGATPADTPESVSFVLRARDLSQLKSDVEQGVRHFLSVSQFAQTYGQTPGHIQALEAFLAVFGIESQSDADGLDVVATGTAGQFDEALAVDQLEYHVPAHSGSGGTAGVPSQTVHGSPKAPQLPTLLAREVLTVLGLTDYGPFTSQAVHADLAVGGNGSIGANQCVVLSGLPDACNVPADFAANYGLNPLIDGGSTGAGQTIGIVTQAALDPGAPQYFWTNVLGLPATGRTVTVENVDGGPGAPNVLAGTDETDLDVEQSGGLAPGANVIVYQSPNSANGFADAFFDAASQNIAGSVSASWGVSETALQLGAKLGLEPATYTAAFDEAFLEMAEQGQSTFAAAGDAGAYGASRDIGATDLSVIEPGGSAFLTSAGGTTLPWSGAFTGPTGSFNVSVPSQRAWGWDYLWPAIAKSTGEPRRLAAESEVIGGGGGFSADEPRPLYQQAVAGTKSYRAVRYLTPTKATDVGGIDVPTDWRFDADPSTTDGTGSGRAVPDVSADADPMTGYLVYDPSAAALGEPALEGGWGGTSFVAPQLNGSSAVIESYLGHRVGFWNPLIYALASSARSPFTPLQQSGTMNDNLFYTGDPGAVYNEATGLGVPDLSELAAALRR